MRNTLHMRVLGSVVLMGAATFFAGCKSAPDLSEAQALQLVQAKYDQTPVGATVLVDDLGMRQGISGKLWERTKMYPNKYWADFKLTDAGKKAVKLPNGGDTIEWRPSGLDDKTYSVVMTTVAANPLKAKELTNIQDEMVPGVATAKSASFVEAVNLTGVPDSLQQIAHNPGNRLSARRNADFSLEGSAWVLHAIR